MYIYRQSRGTKISSVSQNDGRTGTGMPQKTVYTGRPKEY